MTNTNEKNVSVDLTENKDTLECYITIKGEKIPCSREVYLAYKRPVRKEAMRRYRNKQKPFIDGRRCTSDCTTCVYYIEGVGCAHPGDKSLDLLRETTHDEPVAPQNMEDELHVKLTIETMYNELKAETECCREVFSLMIQETPQRTIAVELGISDGTVTYYVKKIRKRLEKFR